MMSLATILRARQRVAVSSVHTAMARQSMSSAVGALRSTRDSTSLDSSAQGGDRLGRHRHKKWPEGASLSRNERRFFGTSTQSTVPASVEEGATPAVGGVEGDTAASVHNFKAETLKLLHIMTHSLYTDKEIFVRELISNCSDALEKLRFLQASGQAREILQPTRPLKILITVNPAAKTVTFEDSGVGMTREELIANLGTIAKSGTSEFLQKAAVNQSSPDLSGGPSSSIIGQFGVGFYSAFVVSDRVEVFSKSYLPDSPGYHWQSNGLGTFSVKEVPDLNRGTKIICYLKAEEESSSFASAAKMKEVATKFSSFVAFPLSMVEKRTTAGVIAAQQTEPTGTAEAADANPAAASSEIAAETDTAAASSEIAADTDPAASSSTNPEDIPEIDANGGDSEAETEIRINEQEPLWLRSGVATPEEHLQVFRHLTQQSWSKPMFHLVFQTDAPLTIKSVFYIPEDAPSRFFAAPNSNKSVDLYSRRVLVSLGDEKLLPTWLRFVRGVVDCEDLPLSISRENVQDSRLVQKLSSTLVQRILRHLDSQAKVNPDTYLSFYHKYSHYLKEGLLETTKTNQSPKIKEDIISLLRFHCSERPANTLVSLKEYVEAAHPQQNCIYYFCASNRETALSSPYLEPFRSRGIPVLILLEDIDEFVVMHAGDFQGKRLVSATAGDDELMQQDWKLIKEIQSEDLSSTNVPGSGASGLDELPELSSVQQEEMFSFFRETLGRRVSQVKFSSRMVSSPAVVSGFLPTSLRKMVKLTMRESAASSDMKRSRSGDDALDPDDHDGLDELPVALELNPRHRLLKSLYYLRDTEPVVSRLMVDQIFTNACVAAGILDDPRAMLPRLNELLEVVATFASKSEAQSSSFTDATALTTESQSSEMGSSTGTHPMETYSTHPVEDQSPHTNASLASS